MKISSLEISWMLFLFICWFYGKKREKKGANCSPSSLWLTYEKNNKVEPDLLNECSGTTVKKFVFNDLGIPENSLLSSQFGV